MRANQSSSSLLLIEMMPYPSQIIFKDNFKVEDRLLRIIME